MMRDLLMKYFFKFGANFCVSGVFLLFSIPSRFEVIFFPFSSFFHKITSLLFFSSSILSFLLLYSWILHAVKLSAQVSWVLLNQELQDPLICCIVLKTYIKLSSLQILYHSNLITSRNLLSWIFFSRKYQETYFLEFSFQENIKKGLTYPMAPLFQYSTFFFPI